MGFNMINLENISREFTYFEKKEGVKQTLKTLFRRTSLTKTAVKDFNLKIEEGQIIGLIGPNGAGKTTLIKMMTGIIRPTRGIVTVDGYTPSELKNEYKRSFSVVMGQKSQLWWDLPAMDSFVLHRHIYKIGKEDFEQRVESLTTLFDVKDLLYVQVRKLSLGERMKMEIILSLLHKPKILYLDEPTIGLDLVAQKKMQEFLMKINKEQNVTIILTSHYMADILKLCHRVVVINEGLKIYDQPIGQIDEKSFIDKVEKLYEGEGEHFIEEESKANEVTK